MEGVDSNHFTRGGESIWEWKQQRKHSYSSQEAKKKILMTSFDPLQTATFEGQLLIEFSVT